MVISLMIGEEQELDWGGEEIKYYFNLYLASFLLARNIRGLSKNKNNCSYCILQRDAIKIY